MLELALQPADLGTHLHAQLGVEVRQRLVHQERRRLADDRPAHRHPLALATGELAGLAIEHRFELQRARRLVDPLLRLVRRHTGELQRIADVLAHGHVRVQRVALEDHGDVALAWLGVGDVATVDRTADPRSPPRGRRSSAAASTCRSRTGRRARGTRHRRPRDARRGPRRHRSDRPSRGRGH